MSENYFKDLFDINVNEHVEEKNGLSYLSWAWCWSEVKKIHPDATYIIYENPALGNMPYFTDGKTAMVKTGMIINGIEHIEYLPVMDYKNRSIPIDSITSFDVNKTIQRSLTKAAARHGLGLYIYAGEDLPEADVENQTMIKSVIAQIDTLVRKNVTDENKSDVTEFIKGIIGTANYKTIDNLDVATTLLKEVSKYFKSKKEAK